MRKTRFSSSSRSIVLLTTLLVVLVSAAALQALSGDPGADGADPDEGVTIAAGEPLNWKDVDQLISEQKFEAASKAVDGILVRARKADDSETWTRALVEETKLRMALHGYETAVRYLKEQPWPEDAVSQAVLELYYAKALATYARVYSWEIRQRERVETTDELDLKKWDLEQIVAESDRAFLELWTKRGEWGSESLGELSRYIAQNNFPPRIRGTLRDAVTYLWAELLSDSSLWSPAESNEVFRLPVQALIEGQANGSAEADLGDSDVHPLIKVGALLDDLEAWHEDSSRPESALEARLERLRRLHTALPSTQDKLAVRRNLESVQQAFDNSLGWWSMGQAVLAEFVQTEAESDALVRARDIAIKGRDRHPESIGGRRCAHHAAVIEAPTYSMAMMATDGAGRRSIRIEHRNFKKIYFRAYRHDIEKFIRSSKDYSLLPDHREAEKIMEGNDPVSEWSTDLPATPDFRSHNTFSVPDLDQAGAYLVVASMRADFEEAGNLRVADNFILSDLVLVTRTIPGGYEVTARSGASGRALEGADISLYRYDYRKGHREMERQRSGDDGRVTFKHARWQREQYFVFAKRHADLALDTTRLHLSHEGSRGVSSSAMIYTDRSAYRPQQEIFWKVVAYRGGGEAIEYETVPKTDITVSLVDANGEEVGSTSLSTNTFGSASGSFTIPAGRLLGRWWLRTSFGGQNWFRVEEYKRPTFSVEISEPEVSLRLNREAELTGEVSYYFGLPVVSGDVKWSVTREPVYPRWWSWWYPRASGQRQVVAAGESGLDDEGRFRVQFIPEADEREAGQGVTYRYRLGVDVTDEGGETRSAERVFRLGFVAVEARIIDDLGFRAAKEDSTVRVLRTDLDGTPRAGTGSWRLLRLDQPSETLTPADQPLPLVPGGHPGLRTPGRRAPLPLGTSLRSGECLGRVVGRRGDCFRTRSARRRRCGFGRPPRADRRRLSIGLLHRGRLRCCL